MAWCFGAVFFAKKFTVGTDRLPAVGDLMSGVSRLIRGDYGVGFWKHIFLHELVCSGLETIKVLTLVHE